MKTSITRLSFFYFWYFAFIGAFAPFFSLYLHRCGYQPFEIAFLLGISPLLRVVIPFFWAWAADRFSSRDTLIKYLSLISPVCLAAIFFKPGFVLTSLILIIWGIIWSGILPLVEALTLDETKSRMNAYGRIRAWGSIGFILIVLGGGYLFESIDILNLDFFLVTILLLVALSVLYLPRGEDSSSDQIGTNPSLFPLLRNVSVIGLLVVFFIMQFSHGAYNAFFSLFLVEVGYSERVVGWLWAVAVVAEIGMFFVVPVFMRKISLGILLAICFSVAMLRFLLVGFYPHTLWVLVITQIMHAVTFGMFHVVGLAAINKFFVAGFRARGQALYSSIGYGAGGAVGTLTSGYVWEQWGSAYVFYISALSACAGMILTLLMIRSNFLRFRAT